MNQYTLSRFFYAILTPMQIQTPEQPQSFKQSFWELARFALIALVIVVPIRVLIAEPFVVSGSSMIPTFEDGNY